MVLGLSAGTWAARIPAIKAGLHLSPGVLGLALLGPAVGSVLTMPLAGAIMATVPPRRVVQCALLLLAGDAAADHGGVELVATVRGAGRQAHLRGYVTETSTGSYRPARIRADRET